MRFEGEYQTVECEDCGRVISESDDQGWEDNPLCSGCSARNMQKHIKIPCMLCKKPIGEEYFFWNTEDQESLAHKRCVEKLSETKQEDWSDDFG